MVHGGNYTVSETFAGRRVGKHFCATKRLTDIFREHEYSTLPSASPRNFATSKFVENSTTSTERTLEEKLGLFNDFPPDCGNRIQASVTSLILQHWQNAVFLPPHPP